MQKVTFINNRGESIEIGYQFPFFLSRIEGLGDVESDISNQKSPYQDGSTFIDSTLRERPISIEVDILQNLEYNRRILSRVFNPRLGEGILIYENKAGKWEIKAVPEHVPSFPDERPKVHQKALIELIAHDPYWKSVIEQNIKLEDFVKRFHFPLRFPVRFASRGDSRVITNNGHVPTPVKIIFLGEVTNPTIKNLTTGKQISVKKYVPEGSKLVINTAFGEQSIKLVRSDGIEENAFGAVNLFESELFMLEVGDNELSFIAESGHPEVYVEFKEQYVGV
jgi:Phage tail protein